MVEYNFKKKSIEINDTLVVSDLHFGIEDELNKRGHLIRDVQKELIEELYEMTKDKNHLIICGDIKNNYDRVSDYEKRDINNLIKKIKPKITIIRGNHDTMLDFVIDKKIHNYYFKNDFLFIHGDKSIKELSKLPNFKSDYKKAKVIIMGHEHPSVSFYYNNRNERFKCFLETEHDSKKLIVLPSFSEAAFGYDFTKENFQSSILKNKKSSEIKVYLHEDKTYEFESLKFIINSNRSN